MTDDIEAILARQRAAFRADPTPSLVTRRDRLDRLVLALTEGAEELSLALDADFGHRPRVVNLMSDVTGILPDIQLTRRLLGRWMRPGRIRGASLLGVGTVIEKRPVGVVGVIAPWNFPVALAAQPTASALAAGNRVMIKMSEVTPRTADAFARCIERFFDPAEVAVVLGDREVGAAFSALPFDHLFFTGSPAVGRAVAQAAARNLVPVTLELGGKNPAVVAPGTDPSWAADRIVSARLANGGQICLCPDDVYVRRDELESFVAQAMKVFERRVTSLGDGEGPVSSVNEQNAGRVRGLIEDARERGARVLQHTPSSPSTSERRIPPTLVLDVTTDMRIAHEEIFGPVLAVHGYSSIADVVADVTSRPAPLAAYWYGKKGPDFETYRNDVQSGGMTVNDFALHCAIIGAPFGGIGESGSGAYHGRTGFDRFTHQRTLTTSRLPVSMAQLLVPPIPRLLEPIVAWQIKRARRVAARRVGKQHH